MGDALVKKAILLLKMANVWFDLLLAVSLETFSHRIFRPDFYQPLW